MFGVALKIDAYIPPFIYLILPKWNIWISVFVCNMYRTESIKKYLILVYMVSPAIGYFINTYYISHILLSFENDDQKFLLINKRPNDLGIPKNKV